MPKTNPLQVLINKATYLRQLGPDATPVGNVKATFKHRQKQQQFCQASNTLKARNIFIPAYIQLNQDNESKNDIAHGNRMLFKRKLGYSRTIFGRNIQRMSITPNGTFLTAISPLLTSLEGILFLVFGMQRLRQQSPSQEYNAPFISIEHLFTQCQIQGDESNSTQTVFYTDGLIKSISDLLDEAYQTICKNLGYSLDLDDNNNCWPVIQITMSSNQQQLSCPFKHVKLDLSKNIGCVI